MSIRALSKHSIQRTFNFGYLNMAFIHGVWIKYQTEWENPLVPCLSPNSHTSALSIYMLPNVPRVCVTRWDKMNRFRIWTSGSKRKTECKIDITSTLIHSIHKYEPPTCEVLWRCRHTRTTGVTNMVSVWLYLAGAEMCLGELSVSRETPTHRDLEEISVWWHMLWH